jgi:RNA polymerase sigma-70 factor (ECF subfamily)
MRQAVSPGAQDTPKESSPRHELPTSISLIARLCGQEEAAWNDFAGLYAPLVVRWCYRQSVPESDISDVMQEVFMKVNRGLADFRKETSADSFRGWLCRITHNEITSYRRRQIHHPPSKGGTDFLTHMQELPDRPLTEPTAEDAAQETRYLYQQAMNIVRSEFSDSAWKIFWRVAVDGNSATAVAEEFGTTSAAVRQTKSRILRRLKQIVGDVGE